MYSVKTLGSSFKGAVFIYHTTVMYRNFHNRSSTLNVLKEAFVSNQVVFYLSKNFYLVDELNEKSSRFKSSGLIKFWRSKFADNDQNANMLKHIPSKLKVKHLQGIFSLLIDGFTISAVTFLIELSVHFCRRFTRFRIN